MVSNIEIPGHLREEIGFIEIESFSISLTLGEHGVSCFFVRVRCACDVRGGFFWFTSS